MIIVDLNQYRCVEPSTEFSDFQNMLSKVIDGQCKRIRTFVISPPESDPRLFAEKNDSELIDMLREMFPKLESSAAVKTEVARNNAQSGDDSGKVYFDVYFNCCDLSELCDQE